MTLKTRPFDEAEYLETVEDQAGYLALAFETGDTAHIQRALGIVARAKGMTEIAKAAGVSRESLYRSFSEGGNPALATVEKVLFTLGLQLTVKRITTAQGTPAKGEKSPKRVKKAHASEDAHA